MMTNVKDVGIGVSYSDVQSTGSIKAIVNLEKATLFCYGMWWVRVLRLSMEAEGLNLLDICYK
jgi:hypothetical protein